MLHEAGRIEDHVRTAPVPAQRAGGSGWSRHRLLDEVLAYTRQTLGAGAAARIGEDAEDERDAILDAVCVLTCAGVFPSDPLGQAMVDVVADRFASVRGI